MEDVSASKNPKRTDTKKGRGYDAQNTFLLEDEANNRHQYRYSGHHTDEGQTKRTIPLGKEEILKAVAHHSPGIDTSITTMMSYVGMVLDFRGIREEDINETDFGSRLDELGKVAIKKKHFGHPFLSQCFYWIYKRI